MRFFAILKVIISYRLDKLIKLPWWLLPIKLLILLTPYAYGKKTKLSRGEKIANALEDLGVIFIKFGQVLSTRRDLLPDDIGLELAKLQENCRPFSNEEAITIIEQELGDYVHNIFDDFSQNPIAAASIAQVYTAKLKTTHNAGTDVVVKVVRPGIEQQIKRDLKLLYKLAKIANLHAMLKRLRPVQVIQEFELIISNEPNMLYESANAMLLRKNFSGNDLLYVPQVFSDVSSKKVLVMERIYGTPISNINTLKEQGICLKTLAENGVKIFFTQVFKHNFFHADMHPGNILVAENGQYNGVDFGIMGSLSYEDRIITAKLFQAFFNEDYQKIAAIFIDSGWIKEDTNKVALENAFRMICAPMFAKDLGEISFGEVLMNLFNEARKFDAYIQPQLLLLDKTLLSIEGLGRQLYPQLDLWQTAKPLLDEIVASEFSFKNKLQKATENMPEMLQTLSNIPTNINQIVANNAKQQQLNLALIHKLKTTQIVQNILLVVLIFMVLL
jgi:ubiquinone biosynthesis protein